MVASSVIVGVARLSLAHLSGFAGFSSGSASRPLEDYIDVLGSMRDDACFHLIRMKTSAGGDGCMPICLFHVMGIFGRQQALRLCTAPHVIVLAIRAHIRDASRKLPTHSAGLQEERQ